MRPPTSYPGQRLVDAAQHERPALIPVRADGEGVAPCIFVCVCVIVVGWSIGGFVVGCMYIHIYQPPPSFPTN